ncbi:hypothetical protein Bca4012_027653 [Brassica carinata]|uniref:Replication protein A 70 kDa DNA-binding subunit B/D first OB fold domain-containing protein n=1 Tax=Brassica carinata TaxID=52824 RepID=A0A8X8AW04_BRACI|nr:hypothetical protein Bca52824_024630 [Brassica carinata]
MRGASAPHCGMILGDEKGFTMEATLPFDIALPKGIYLEESSWFEVYNFEFKRVFELVRTTRSKYNIRFTDATIFTKIQPIIDSNFLSLTNFCTIRKGLWHPMYCIDLCGARVAVGELQQLEELGNGKIYSYQNTRMEFTFVNTDLTNLKCVAYGNEAMTLTEYYRTSRATVNYKSCIYSFNFETLESFYRIMQKHVFSRINTSVNTPKSLSNHIH